MKPVQGLQHEPVAAERDDDSAVSGDVAIAGSEPLERLTRLGTGAGDKGYSSKFGVAGSSQASSGMVDASGRGAHGGAAPAASGEHGARGLRLYDLSIHCRGGAGRTRLVEQHLCACVNILQG